MKLQTYDSMEQILKIVFFHASKMGCHNDNIPEKATVWLFLYFIKKVASRSIDGTLVVEVKVFAL